MSAMVLPQIEAAKPASEDRGRRSRQSSGSLSGIGNGAHRAPLMSASRATVIRSATRGQATTSPRVRRSWESAVTRVNLARTTARQGRPEPCSRANLG